MPVYDSLCDFEQDIRHILVRHEQGAVHAAQGYARIKGQPGVVIVTSGPGATNVVTGIVDALTDSTPPSEKRCNARAYRGVRRNFNKWRKKRPQFKKMNRY